MRTSVLSSLKLSRSRSGFSLIELLTVVAILGVMATLAMGAFGGARQGAVDQKDKRNAQEIASQAAMASAAGAPFIVEEDERATIENLRAGSAPNHGAFKGRLFKLPAMGDTEIVGAMRFLVLGPAGLQYRLDGSSP